MKPTGRRLESLFRSVARRARSLLSPWSLPVFYDRRFRLPLPSAALPSGLELRRADYVVWYLLRGLKIDPECIRPASPISFRALRLVHGAEMIESLLEPEALADIYAALPSEVSVDDVWATIRVACGATSAGVQLALRRSRPVLNLLGGFHHAARHRPGPLCPVNDIAVAVAVARERGFDGSVAILDLDAHPPDGTADCLAGEPGVWIGSISGSDWGDLPDDVDDTVLPEGSGDPTYLRALDELLARMPGADLSIVIAGGDVRAGDSLGALALSDDGITERDRRVRDALAGRASLWLPGGGYSSEAWRTLARTALVLAERDDEPIDARFDPLAAEFWQIHTELGRELEERGSGAFDGGPIDLELTEADLGLGIGSAPGPVHLLGMWSASGIEYALSRYGILEQISRLGYRDFRVVVDRASVGERMRLFGGCHGVEHLLIELVVEVRELHGYRLLFVHWMTLRNPRARFTEDRPRLPGQEVPGLGLGREATLLIAGMARRLGLAGGAFRPAWYHMAYAGRHGCRFVDPSRQGRFEALIRDLDAAGLTLLEATTAVDGGRVLVDGQLYRWEADDMVMGLPPPSADWRYAVEVEKRRVRFELAPRPA